MKFDTPVAFLVFNRPDLTRKVFESIRQARPERLLVVADGPRPQHPADEQNCRDVRRVIEGVDWPCEVQTEYAPTNLGCGPRISSGLNWVFGQVEEAIVLEDDCLPHPAFFGFCQTLLGLYRDDERIMHIGGGNFQFGRSRSDASYYFSRMVHVWGWASWRRAWKLYDFEMLTWPAFRDGGLMRQVFEDPAERGYWTGVLDRLHRGPRHTWDYQWWYTVFSQGGLAIIPETNLVSNIGANVGATHHADDLRTANLPACDPGPMVVPGFTVRNRDADSFHFRELVQGRPVGPLRAAARVARRALARLLADRR